MSNDFYEFCLAHNRRDHAILVALSLLFFPLTYLSLDLPKDIVNVLTAGAESGEPVNLGVVDVVGLPAVSEFVLVVGLAAALLTVLAGRAGLGYVVDNRETLVGQRLLRRLRYQLLGRLMRLPSHHWDHLSEGETVSALLSETRDFSRFGAQVLTVPVRQAGTFLVILAFVLLQNWIMGLALLVMYPLQATVFYRLQRQIIAARLAAIREERSFSDRVGETMHRLPEVHANDASRFELAQMTRHLQGMAETRWRARERKAYTTLVNAVLNGILPICFYVFGGYLVLTGDLTIGALVAVVAAHASLTEPWTAILDFVQRGESLRGQFAQLLARFDADDMLDESALAGDGAGGDAFPGRLVGRSVVLAERDGTPVLEQSSFTIDLRRPTAIVGSSRAVLARLAHLLARLGVPSGGELEVAGTRYDRISQSVTGRRIGYIGEDSVIISGSVRENLVYGLQHHPPRARSRSERELRLEAEKSGNPYFQADADWIDYEAAGVTGPEDLTRRMLEILDQVELMDDVLAFGLGMRIDPDDHPGLATKILDARERFARRAAASGVDASVEIFDRARFSTNSSLAENIVFGSSLNPVEGLDGIVAHPFMREVLDEVDLRVPLLDLGLRIARSTMETFRDMSEGDAFHLDFSLIPLDDFAAYRDLIARARGGDFGAMADADQSRLLRLAFRLTPAYHRLELVDAPFERRVLAARDYFSRNVPPELGRTVDLFDAGHFNSGVSIESNVVFGRLRHGQHAELRVVRALIEECARDADMLGELAELGLDFHVGRRGYRLLPSQRQKLVAARVVLKRPEVVIVNNAPGWLTGRVPARIFESSLRERPDTGLVWLGREVPKFVRFADVLRLEDGRLVAAAGGEHPREEGVPAAAGRAGSPASESDVATLRRVPWFENWSTPRLRLLLLTSPLERFRAGEFLFRQGDRGDWAYVLVSGSADVVIHPGGEDHVLRRVTAPELVGEISLLCDTPRSASIVTISDAVALRVAKVSVEAILARDPRIAAEVMQLLGHRLYDMVERYENARAG